MSGAALEPAGWLRSVLRWIIVSALFIFAAVFGPS